mmetsp:Transcript_13258/g.25410  ORF Transcript_13258/g.25410 Transcript_13258/m.25410 type:complete len:367 (-) Transcript_13258:68-1168(-)
MGSASYHLCRTAVPQQAGRGGEGAGGVDHVVHQQRHLALHVSNQVVHLGHVVRLATLVHDGKRRVGEALGKPPRARNSAHVRGHHHHLRRGHAPGGEVVERDNLPRHVLHGDIEVAGALARVQVHGNDAVAPAARQEVGRQLGRNALAPRGPAVGARVSKVWNHGGDVASGSPSAGVNHHQQLHEVVVGGGAGGLNQEHIAAANGLLQLHVHLSIRKALDVDFAQVKPEVHGDVLGELRVGTPGEDTKPALWLRLHRTLLVSSVQGVVAVKVSEVVCRVNKPVLFCRLGLCCGHAHNLSWTHDVAVLHLWLHNCSAPDLVLGGGGALESRRHPYRAGRKHDFDRCVVAKWKFKYVLSCSNDKEATR